MLGPRCLVLFSCVLASIPAKNIKPDVRILGPDELNVLHADAVKYGSAGKNNLWFKAIDAGTLDKLITEMNDMNRYFAKVVRYWDDFTSGGDGSKVLQMSDSGDGAAEAEAPAADPPPVDNSAATAAVDPAAAGNDTAAGGEAPADNATANAPAAEADPAAAGAAGGGEDPAAAANATAPEPAADPAGADYSDDYEGGGADEGQEPATPKVGAGHIAAGGSSQPASHSPPLPKQNVDLNQVHEPNYREMQIDDYYQEPPTSPNQQKPGEGGRAGGGGGPPSEIKPQRVKEGGGQEEPQYMQDYYQSYDKK